MSRQPGRLHQTAGRSSTARACGRAYVRLTLDYDNARRTCGPRSRNHERDAGLRRNASSVRHPVRLPLQRRLDRDVSGPLPFGVAATSARCIGAFQESGTCEDCMRILLDECLPRPLKKLLTGHECVTARERGWDGKRNGDLLHLAEQEFDIFLTVD